SVGSDKTFHLGHWFFTPSPFVFGLGAADDAWLMAGVLAPGAANFSGFEVAPGEGVSLSLSYDGHERVAGDWRWPALAFRPAPDRDRRQMAGDVRRERARSGEVPEPSPVHRGAASPRPPRAVVAQGVGPRGPRSRGVRARGRWNAARRRSDGARVRRAVAQV